MGSFTLVLPNPLRHQRLSLRYSQPLIPREFRPFPGFREAYGAGIFGFLAPGSRPRLGVKGSRPGVKGSRLGVTGSRLGVTGSRLGVKGSRLGVTGSRLGVKGSRLGVISSRVRGCSKLKSPPCLRLGGEQMPDYIPNSDADFNTWQENFYAYAAANLAALGLTAADLAPITAAQSAWATGKTTASFQPRSGCDPKPRVAVLQEH
jgi:hypothetical protein